MKKIYLAADHGGFKLKRQVEAFLIKKGFTVKDFGAFEYHPRDDYPDFVIPVAKRISQEHAKKRPNSLAIIFGGSGQGEAMCANRFKNVRATVYYDHDKKILEVSKKHNNANILSIGARFVDKKTLEKDILFWINTKFSGKDRYKRRQKKY